MSAAVSVQDAIYAALVADDAFATWRTATVSDPRIYEVLAPAGIDLVADDGTPRPYVTLSGGTEGDFNAFCAAGYEDALRVRTWAPGAGERLAKVGYGHVRRLLDGVALTLAGHTCLRCTVALERTLTDPDGGATQAIAVVTVMSEET